MKKKLKDYMIEACNCARDNNLRGKALEKYVKELISEMLGVK
jgi:hypothetical protein